jgi:tRNA G18 (ribose-2'-O)-methylase SpoU
MHVLRADGPKDPRLADYQDVRDKDLRRDGVFLVEGEVTVLQFLERSHMRPRSVLLSDRRLGPMRERLERLVGETPVYAMSQESLEEVVGFPIHRGVIAAGDRPPPRVATELLQEARRILLLEGLTNHDNVGACFRNAAAFGVDAVLLDSRCCDPLYRKAIRVSAGAALTVPWAVMEDGPEMIAACRDAGLHVVALTPMTEAAPLSEVLTVGPTALLVGTEGPGLTHAALDGAHVRARIPMDDGFDSLNVATAAAVALAFQADLVRRA